MVLSQGSDLSFHEVEIVSLPCVQDLGKMVGVKPADFVWITFELHDPEPLCSKTMTMEQKILLNTEIGFQRNQLKDFCLVCEMVLT